MSGELPRHRYLESMEDILERFDRGRVKARPTTYRGVTFRSELEARFARHLEAIGEEWRYEPRIYGSAGSGYLPDFEIVGARRRTFVEVKPLLEDAPAAKVKAAVIWDAHPDALIIIAVEQNATFFAALRGEKWSKWQQRWAA